MRLYRSQCSWVFTKKWNLYDCEKSSETTLTHTHTRAHTHTHTHTHTCVHAHTHTHTHTCPVLLSHYHNLAQGSHRLQRGSRAKVRGVGFEFTYPYGERNLDRKSCRTDLSTTRARACAYTKRRKDYLLSLYDVSVVFVNNVIDVFPCMFWICEHNFQHQAHSCFSSACTSLCWAAM